jgi:hypothetical protein
MASSRTEEEVHDLRRRDWGNLNVREVRQMINISVVEPSLQLVSGFTLRGAQQVQRVMSVTHRLSRGRGEAWYPWHR